MKAKILIILIVLFFVGTGPIGILSGCYGVKVLAQEREFPEPGLTPDSRFYFVEIIAEKIVTFFTFGDLKKAQRHVNLAAERMAETQAVAEKGKVGLIEKSLQRYEDQLIKASLRLEKAKIKGKNTEELAKTIDEVTHKYYSILEKALEEAAEDVKPAIRHAMIISTKEGLELIAETASAEGLESIKAECIEKQGQSEMCEKIPVQGFESFEALGVFCTELGGPAEICSSLEPKCGEFGVTTANECFLFLSSSSATIQASPARIQTAEPGQIRQQTETQTRTEYLYADLQTKCMEAGGSAEACGQLPQGGFESFEEILAYCLETGGSPEVCALLENRCREAGVITPDECFLFLAISSLEAFQSTELKTSPAPSLSEEEIEEEIEQTQGQGEGEPEPTKTEESLKQHYIPGVSKVIIYSIPTCPHCAEAKSWFQLNNIEYEEIDISQNEAIQNELIEQVGQLVVPIIKVEDDMIIGFNEERLSEFFGIE